MLEQLQYLVLNNLLQVARYLSLALRAAHGTTCPGANERLVAMLGGTSVKLRSIQRVLEVLHAAIVGVGDAGVG